MTMVKVTLTLQLKREVWYMVACDIHTEDGIQPLILPNPPKRKFLSQEAALNYVKRIVLGRLKRQKNDATGADITCHLNVRPPG